VVYTIKNTTGCVQPCNLLKKAEYFLSNQSIKHTNIIACALFHFVNFFNEALLTQEL